MKIARIIGVAMLGTALIASTAAAAPNANIKRGHASINFNYNVTAANNSKGAKAGNYDVDGSATRMPGIDVRVGVVDKVGLQYKYNGTKTTDTPAGIGSIKTRTQEYNIYYEVAPGASIYAGVINNRMESGLGNDSRDVLQLGGQYVTKLSNKMTGFANAGFGKGVQHAEVGIGYEVYKNLDLDLSYRYNQFELHDSNEHRDNGVILGLTYKF